MVPSLAAIVARTTRPRSIPAVRATCYRWQRGRVAVDHEGGVVAAVRFADDGDAGRHRWQLAGPAHAHLADLGEVQPARVEREAVAGEPDRLATALGPVPRAADPAALALARQRVEPVAVGTVRVLAGLHQHHGGDLGQPRPLGGVLCEGDDASLDLGVAQLLPGLVGTPPFGEGVVIDNPRAPQRPGERLTLPGGRVDAAAVPDQHATEHTWSMRQAGRLPPRKTRLSALNMHLVFVTSDRRGVLTGEHLETLREVFASVCADFDAKLVEMGRRRRPRAPPGRLTTNDRGLPACELPQGRLRSPPAPPRAHPPGANVPVVLRRVGRWRPAERHSRPTSASSAPSCHPADPALNGQAYAREIAVRGAAAGRGGGGPRTGRGRRRRRR